MRKIKLLCKRCGHDWVPRKKNIVDVITCPKCTSPYWNKPRRGAIKNVN